MATIDWFTGSKVGVIAAPSTNAMTIAYLRCLARNSGVTIPILDKKKRIDINKIISTTFKFDDINKAPSHSHFVSNTQRLMKFIFTSGEHPTF